MEADGGEELYLHEQNALHDLQRSRPCETGRTDQDDFCLWDET